MAGGHFGCVRICTSGPARTSWAFVRAWEWSAERIYFRGPHKGFYKSDAKADPNRGQRLGMADRKPQRPFSRQSAGPNFTPFLPGGRNGNSCRPEGRMKNTPNPSARWRFFIGMSGFRTGPRRPHRRPRRVRQKRYPAHNHGFSPALRAGLENRKFAAPCEASCPTGIPVHERWRLIREGRVDEAMDLAMAYTPFPASVCGYLCPNLCMQGCTRQTARMISIDVTQLGKASLKAKLPELPSLTGIRIAIIGGGPSGHIRCLAVAQAGARSDCLRYEA